MNRCAFDHVLIIMFENQYRGYVMENEYFRNLAAQGIELTNSFGVMHPSQTNYITSISGELCNMSDDDPPKAPLKQNTIVDLIEASPLNIDWRAYMDSYVPGWTPWKEKDFKPVDTYPYVMKHNPFSSYENILNNQQRWEKIDNEAGFYRDLLNGTFPQYAWFTPNMWHDGHYLISTKDDDLKGERAPTLVNQQADWLKSFFAGLNFPGPNSKLPPRTLVVVTYDEADFEADYDPPSKDKYFYDGPNQIYTVLLGDMIEPGQQHEGYNHYSLLKTIEQNFNLGDLGKNDRDSNYFQFLWGREFQWQSSQQTGLGDVLQLDACQYQNQLFISYISSDKKLYYRTFDGKQLSPPILLSDSCGDSVSITANDNELVLAYQDADQQLQLRSYSLTSGWLEAQKPVAGKINQCSVTAIPNQTALLLAYSDEQGNVYSSRNDDGQWQQPDRLIAQSDGQVALCALGSNILLLYKVPGTNSLACLTYNTAPFNKVTVESSKYAGQYDDTTVNEWSPCAYSVNSYSFTPTIMTPAHNKPTDEPAPDCAGYHADGKITCATLDGVVHLLHNNSGSRQLVTETFSLGGILTPRNPVSYDPQQNDTTSNGYGTMYEAGWSQQQAVPGILRAPDSPMTVAQFNGALWLFYQGVEGGDIQVCRAGYVSCDNELSAYKI